MANDVFISYSAKDKTVADAVCATLESKKIRCWIAPRDALPGMNYAEALINAIHQSRIFVLVFSASANDSSQVMREVERAVNQGIPIIPFRIENIKPSGSMEYFLSTPHWLDAMTPPLEKHLATLTTSIQALLGRVPETSEKGIEQEPIITTQSIETIRKKKNRLVPIISGLGAVAVIAVCVFFLIDWLGSQEKALNGALLSPTTNPTSTATPAPTSTATSSASSITPAPAPVSKPDLVIQEITWTPNNPSLGDDVTFTIVVTNMGKDEALSSHISYYIDGVFKDTISVYQIGSGQTARISFVWKAELGTHAIKVITDFNNSVEESDETNNEKEITFSGTMNVDLLITDITWTPTILSRTEPMYFSVNIFNQGKGRASSFELCIYYDDHRQVWRQIDSLLAGESATIILQWARTYDYERQPGIHTFKFVIDAGDQVPESNETNNSKTFTLTIP